MELFKYKLLLILCGERCKSKIIEAIKQHKICLRDLNNLIVWCTRYHISDSIVDMLLDINLDYDAQLLENSY